MLADMVETQETPRSRPVEVGGLQRRLELAARHAAGHGAMRRAPSTRPCSLACFDAMEPLYIVAMNAPGTGPVAAEMLRRLDSALTPTRIELIDDSEQHRGHGGYNPAGESHFSLRDRKRGVHGKGRVERQRLIHAALGDLMDERVHALSIRRRHRERDDGHRRNGVSPGHRAGHP